MELLNSIRGPSYGGDPSRQDSALITALLSSGLSPGDTYYTFINSVRGGDAKFRKPGHVEDYVKRTIQKSLGYLKWASSNGNSQNISVDFSGEELIELTTKIESVLISQVAPEKVSWLWDRRIPIGKVS